MSGAVGFEVKTSLSLSSHRIRKRSTSTGGLNPCAGNLQQVIIYEAEDWQDGTVHELVHDPGKIVSVFCSSPPIKAVAKLK